MHVDVDSPPSAPSGPRDDSVFPDATYKDTVLAPLFEGAKAHHIAPFRQINRAHCVMLAETGILTPDEGASIARALQEIDAEDLSRVPYTGEVEDVFFYVEAALAKLLGPDLAGRLHTGRSRNDMDHTIYRLALKAEIDRLAEEGRALAGALLDKAEAERDTIIVAYTHGQPAQPSTFGHYLAAALEVLLRDLARLEAARDVVDRSPMGAAAITTTGFPIDRHRMAELLGFAVPLENSYGCIASVDYVTATYSAVKLIFLHLGRVVQDLQQWTAFEVGQLYVPNAFVQISSIMPQKRNPVPIEHLRLLSSLTVGRADMMTDVMHNTPFTDMNDSEGPVQVAGYPAFESGGRVLALLRALVPALVVDAARVQRNIDASCITVTELADGVVRREGLPFRQAHEIAAVTSKEVLRAGAGLGEGYEAFRSAFETLAGRATGISADEFRQMTSPEHFVAVRDRFGGPAPAALDAAFAGYCASLADLAKRAKENQKRESASQHLLAEAFERLAAS
jgi:argininosuccinate lyase